jgi:hypothetical protein
MVDIESADATSAPVISVRFKLASFLLSKEGERRGQSLVPGLLHVFPDTENLMSPLCKRRSRHVPNYPDRSEPTRIAPVKTASLNEVRKNVMKALSGLGRNDVTKAVALFAIVVFPLIAHAQLGRSSGAVKTSQDMSPVAGAAVKTAAARAVSCADQHWPFFSAECLRQSTQAVEPRLVSMNAETSPISAAKGDAPKPVRAADIVRDNEPFAGSKKPAKPRIAAHRHERRTPNANYAANFQAGQVPMPGW